MSGLAASQFGAAARWQAREIGIDSHALDRRVACGSWQFRTPIVVVSAGAPPSRELDAQVALLDSGPGSALTKATAAAFYDAPGFAVEPIHVSRPRGRASCRRRPPEGVEWHHPRFLPAHHLLVVNGLLMTNPTRTIADVGGMSDVSAKRAERLINTFWASGLTSRPELETMADEWCERGRPGSAFLHEYLATRPVSWVPPASNLAGRFIDVIKSAGMPEPRSEVNVGSQTQWLGRVDCLDPELPLIAEINSTRFHVAPLDVAHDKARSGRISRAGFEVVDFDEFEVWHQRDVVVERWRRARSEVRSRRAN